MRPKSREQGFGLVAAMFLIIVVALLIAAMAHLATVQNATSSMAIQQARAYQTARAGIEYGISSVLNDQVCSTFTLDGFQVQVTCTQSLVNLPEEDRAGVEFYTITSSAEFGVPGQPDYAFRLLTSVVERP